MAARTKTKDGIAGSPMADSALDSGVVAVDTDGALDTDGAEKKAVAVAAIAVAAIAVARDAGVATKVTGLEASEEHVMAKKETKSRGGSKKSAENPVETLMKENENLKTAVQQIEKAFGNGAIMTLGGDSVKQIRGIPTGSLSLDIALGGQGLPCGRIIEVFGPESSGKTTIALHAIAQAQKAGGVAAFIDAEHAFDPTWAKKLGVDLDTLLISQPSSGEEALQITEMLVKSNAVDIIVVDSVAALVPKQELDGEIGDTFVGLQARLMSQSMRKLTGAIARSKTCTVFINQIREKIGVMFGSPETTPGGRALKFYCSCRIDVRKIGAIKDGEDVVGQRVKCKIVKNKVAPPFRTAEFDMMHNNGISYEGDILDLGIATKVVGRTGAWLKYGSVHLGQGKEKARAYLIENPALTEEIKAKVLAESGQIADLTAEKPSPEEAESDEMEEMVEA